MRTCAVDFETGGLVSGFHPALSVAIVPLNDDFTIDEGSTPFVTDIGVDNLDRVDPGALAVNGKTIEDIKKAPPRLETVKAFFAWSREFGKFAPLGQNWAFDKGFFQHWLDPEYKSLASARNGIWESYIDYRARDLARVACFIIDRAKATNQPPFFKGMSLEKISAALGVVNPQPHTAYGDACTAALCYSKLVKG